MQFENINNDIIAILDTTSTGTQKTTFAKLIADAEKEGITLVFSTVAAVFLAKENIPLNWGGRLKGCTNQITALANNFQDPTKIKVYIINKRDSNAQKAWLASKGFQHVHMLSDADNSIQELLDLQVLECKGEENKYLDRVTWIIRPGSKTPDVIEIKKPEDKPQNIESEDAEKHVRDIQEVLTPKSSNVDRPYPIPH